MNKTMLMAASLALTIGLTGCAASNTVKTKSKESHIINETAVHDTRKADEVSSKIARIHGVQRATVIVNQKDAVVGVDVKPGVHPAMVESEARRTAEHLLPGHRVHVTSDPNIHARIQNVRSQMRPLDGHPVRNFAEDVATIIRDVGRTASAPFRGTYPTR